MSRKVTDVWPRSPNRALASCVPLNQQRTWCHSASAHCPAEMPVSKIFRLTTLRLLDRSDVNLFHLHHWLERALGSSRIGISDRFRQGDRCNLPGQSPFVLSSKQVQQWLAQHKGQIELCFWPSYSPELNPTEYLNRIELHALDDTVLAKINRRWLANGSMPQGLSSFGIQCIADKVFHVLGD